MKFQAVNELSHFSPSDCVLIGIGRDLVGIQFTLKALIVLPENSQNTNFTKSYVGSVQLHLIDEQLTDSVREGYLYRDANGKFPEPVPGTAFSSAEVGTLLLIFRNVYLFQIPGEAREDRGVLLELGIEFPQVEEFDTLVTLSYRIGVRYEEVVFDWNYYMNRVES